MRLLYPSPLFLALLMAVPAAAQGQLYWSQTSFGGGTPGIYRSALDGSSVEQVIGRVPFSSIEVDAAGGKVYGRGPDRVLRRANLDGSGVEALGGVTDVVMVRVDPAGEKVYWLDQEDRIRRSALDGSGVETIVGAGASPFRLDLENGLVFWLDEPTGTYRRANLDGSGVVDLHTLDSGVTVSCPFVDPANEQFYWFDLIPSREARRVNYDGTGYEELSVDGCIASVDDGMLYWRGSDGAQTVIRRANRDGTGQEDLVSVSPYANSLTLDPANGTMYWSTDDAVERARLDGTGRTAIVQGFSPSGLRVSSEADALFVTGSGFVLRTALDGSSQQGLFGGVDQPGDLAVDPEAGWAFWVDRAQSYVAAMRIGGGGFRLLGAAPPFGGGGLALDPAEDQVYWIDEDLTIQRANYSGENREAFPTSGEVRAGTLAIDPGARTIYWGQGPSIERANLDGSDRTTVVPDTESPTALVLDPGGERIYWAASPFDLDTGNTEGQVYSVGYDGTGLVTEAEDLDSVLDIARDPAGELYWVLGGGVVQRVRFDGSTFEAETVLTVPSLSGLTFVEGTATSAEPERDPGGLALSAYPNPAIDAVRVTLTLAAPAPSASVAVYDGLGRRVALLHEGPLGAGAHPLALEAVGLPAGVYLVRALTEAGALTRRVTVLR